jgi:histidyl-tRNA synthetase
MALSTQPYRGTRDFYPQDLAKRQYMIDTWRKALKALGYEEYDTPTLENAEMYIQKSGEELGGTQLYNFYDKGERHVALRPEMTPSLARIVANKFGELRFPLRWFSVPNCFRYERPQKGRAREFWQLNVDILGLPAGDVDLEFLYLTAELFGAFGATPDQFVIKFNHRQVLDKWIGQNGLTEFKSLVYEVLDDYHKVEEQVKSARLLEGGLDKSQVAKVLGIQTDNSYIELAKEVEEMNLILNNLATVCPGINFELDPTIVRGLAYYTGLVMEAYDQNRGNPRALFGGGRYDNLMELFDDKKQLPAIGLGWGDVTMAAFLDNWNLWPQSLEQKENKVGLMPFSQEDLLAIYQEILPKLKAQGQPFEIDYDYRRSENKRYESLKKRGCGEVRKVGKGN